VRLKLEALPKLAQIKRKGGGGKFVASLFATNNNNNKPNIVEINN